MKTKLQILFVLAVTVALATFGARNWAAEKPYKPSKGKKIPPYSFVRQPEDRVAEIGTFVAFAVRVTPETNALYQWKFKGENIQGATKREYFIDAASVDKVGAYTVEVAWPKITNIVSTNAFLSVYRRWGENPVFGTLTTSVDRFNSTATYNCAGNPAITFDKIHNPMTNGVYCFLYGPNVPLTQQIPPFINDAYANNVRIDSISAVNGGTPVGIRFLKSFDPAGLPPFDLACQSGFNVTGPIVTVSNLSTDTDVKKARYRISIYYHTPAPPSGNIEINWKYF